MLARAKKTQRCSRCHVEKPKADFDRRKSNGVLLAYCRACAVRSKRRLEASDVLRHFGPRTELSIFGLVRSLGGEEIHEDVRRLLQALHAEGRVEPVRVWGVTTGLWRTVQAPREYKCPERTKAAG